MNAKTAALLGLTGAAVGNVLLGHATSRSNIHPILVSAILVASVFIGAYAFD